MSFLTMRLSECQKRKKEKKKHIYCFPMRGEDLVDKLNRKYFQGTCLLFLTCSEPNQTVKKFIKAQMSCHLPHLSVLGSEPPTCSFST